MNLLLDTHAALWAIGEETRLPTRVRDAILDESNLVFVSAVSIWEIAIKFALARRGKGAMPISAGQALGYFRATGFRLLPVSVEHAAAVERLPRLHADPFDRLLVAQALEEPLRLFTHDRSLADYSDTVILY